MTLRDNAEELAPVTREIGTEVARGCAFGQGVLMESDTSAAFSWRDGCPLRCSQP
jgi:hypothetical protein